VGGLKGSNVNHNNMPNSEPGAGTEEAAAVSEWSDFCPVAMVTLINATR